VKRRTKQEQKLADDVCLLRWWKAWHREQRDFVLAGPHGAMLGELFRMLDNLQHVQPSQLIGFVRSIDWAVIDTDTRLIVLHEINVAIAKLRSSSDLPPINDPLPGQPDNAYRLIRRLFTSFPPRAGERAAASGKSEVETVETSNE